MADILFGRNPVLEALRARRRTCRRLFLATGTKDTGGSLDALVQEAQAQRVPIERVERHIIDRLVSHAHHQGVALEASDYPYAELEETLELAADRNEPPLLLLLDHVQDPQNVGTLLRTAESVGVHGVLLPGRRAAHVTPAVVRASSGATEHLLIANIGNLAQTMKLLRKEGVLVVGVEDDERACSFEQADYTLPLALVVGAEGPGLARLTRDRCDMLVRLPMRGHLASLNVAVAGSVILYHAWRRREASRVE